MSMPSDGETRPPANYEFSVSQTPPESKWGCVVFAIIGALGVGVVVMCCGGVGALFYFGLETFGEDVAAQLRENPVLTAYLGPIESFDIDLIASTNIEGEDVFVFNVRGTQGSGVVTCESITIEDGGEYITWAKLQLPDGTTVDLFSEMNEIDE